MPRADTSRVLNVFELFVLQTELFLLICLQPASLDSLICYETYRAIYKFFRHCLFLFWNYPLLFIVLFFHWDSITSHVIFLFKPGTYL